MALDFQLNIPNSQAISITFENVTFSVPHAKKGKRQILQSICGEFRPGELTAIMGPSGAGKSSLMNIITSFSTKGMQGCVYYNGVSIFDKNRYSKKEICYILQDDDLSPFFTVNEKMIEAAHLKLGSTVSDKTKFVLIDNVLKSLGLLGTKDTRCSSLSGGEKKRLSIALELLSNPSVMFLDEPTTGLDSSASIQCIRLLKELAHNGRTIIITIHQPSAKMFDLFDHVYMLSEGSCIYQGSSNNVLPYLAETGLHCPKYHNIADYLAEVASGAHGDYSKQLSIAAMDSRWRCSPKTTNSAKSVFTNSIIPDDSSELKKLPILIHRNLVKVLRDWTETLLKCLIHIFVGIVVGLNFKAVGNDASKTIENVALIFCIIIYISYTTMMPAMLRFQDEIVVIKKERFNNWYNLKTYYLASLAANAPIQVFHATLIVTILYYMTQQPLDLTRYVMFITISWLTTLTAESIGLYLGTLKSSLHGLFYGSMTLACLLAFSGCLAQFPHMNIYMNGISYLSFGRYAFEGLMISIYGNNRPNIPCPSELVYCHLRSPSKVLMEVGAIDGNYWTDIGALAAMLFILRCIAYAALHRKVTCK